MNRPIGNDPAVAPAGSAGASTRARGTLGVPQGTLSASQTYMKWAGDLRVRLAMMEAEVALLHRRRLTQFMSETQKELRVLCKRGILKEAMRCAWSLPSSSEVGGFDGVIRRDMSATQ